MTVLRTHMHSVHVGRSWGPTMATAVGWPHTRPQHTHTALHQRHSLLSARRSAHSQRSAQQWVVSNSIMPDVTDGARSAVCTHSRTQHNAHKHTGVLNHVFCIHGRGRPNMMPACASTSVRKVSRSWAHCGTPGINHADGQLDGCEARQRCCLRL